MALRPLVVDIEMISEPGRLSGWVLDVSGVLKVYHEAPESRDANEFIIKTVAEKLNIPRSRVVHLKGFSSRFKKFKIGKDISLDELCKALDAKKGQV
ncbi:hypothetical protein E3J79_02440 [Candidatus Dependentiae bacterium]|nr:MAG: hypothetical protein E3J79_02440 [Candidatus Dependentiae bacterium]